MVGCASFPQHERIAMTLHHIIYISKLTGSDETLVKDIVQTALWHNPRKGITGMMLYSEGDILQVLEGAREDIDPLFERIKRDSRHSNIFVVINDALPSRHFPNWSMGYRKISPLDVHEFKNYKEIFQGAPGAVSARARRGVATDVINAFCAWAMR